VTTPATAVARFRTDRRRDLAVRAAAAKANCLAPVLRLLRELGLGCEVASPDELAQALAAGFGPDRIVLDSPVKTRGELAAALTEKSPSTSTTSRSWPGWTRSSRPAPRACASGCG
jgi:diaminopimelate decarboxylase